MIPVSPFPLAAADPLRPRHAACRADSAEPSATNPSRPSRILVAACEGDRSGAER